MTLPRSKRGVPDHLKADFDTFLADKNVDLIREMALLRTLYLEIRSTMDQSQNKAVNFALHQIRSFLQLDGEKEKRVESILREFFEPKPLGLDEAVKLAGILETISRVADRRKKIAEGYSLKVEINESVLIKFLQVCVLPYLSRDQRRLVAERAQRFSIQRALSVVPETVGQSNIIDVEAITIDGDSGTEEYNTPTH